MSAKTETKKVAAAPSKQAPTRCVHARMPTRLAMRGWCCRMYAPYVLSLTQSFFCCFCARSPPPPAHRCCLCCCSPALGVASAVAASFVAASVASTLVAALVLLHPSSALPLLQLGCCCPLRLLLLSGGHCYCCAPRYVQPVREGRV